MTDQPVPKKRAPQRCWYCDAVIVFAPWPGDPKPMPCEPETLEPHHHRRAVLRQGRVA